MEVVVELGVKRVRFLGRVFLDLVAFNRFVKNETVQAKLCHSDSYSIYYTKPYVLEEGIESLVGEGDKCFFGVELYVVELLRNKLETIDKVEMC